MMSTAGRLLLVALAAAGCTEPPASRPVIEPVAAGDGWTVATPAEEGVSALALSGIAERIRQDPHGDLRSLVIGRHGRLVYEGYFNGQERDSLHDIRSATKSITSALLGIAIAEGLIAGVNTPVVPLLDSAPRPPDDDPRRQHITVEHLLTMASGLDADEGRPGSPGYEDRLWESDDWVAFALGLPMATAPGTRWSYAAVNTFMLGAAIENAAGMSLSAYAQERLFGPLGISRFRWATNPAGRTVAQGNLSLRARDMAKFGQLYLDGGRWNGVQIVPAAWVETSLVARYPTPWDGYDAYGYGWYLHTITVGGRAHRYFFASGNGGNKIYVLPDLQMVVAIQSAAYNTSYGQQRSLELLKRVVAATTPPPPGAGDRRTPESPPAPSGGAAAPTHRTDRSS